MKLYRNKIEAAALLSAHLAHRFQSGEIKIDIPTGFGRIFILMEAARRVGRPIAFMTRIEAFGQQVKLACDDLGVTNVKIIKPRDDVSDFFAVILSEELRDMKLDHPRVVIQTNL